MRSYARGTKAALPGLFVICISAGFIAANRMSADYDIQYESLHTEHKTDMTKKEDYHPLVSIHNIECTER